MQIKAEGLASVLSRAARERRMPALITVASDEALLAQEAQDAIRATARGLGYSEREVLQADVRFDWSRLTQAAQGLSLFAQRRIVELRLPSGKPGVAGAAALEEHAQNLADDTLTLIALPRLDRRTRDTRWVGALERAGVLVEIDSVERARLPRWIGERLGRQQQSASEDALVFIAERVEGNLLAAHQEIVKLGLLYPAGELSLEQVADSVLNVARYDVFQLPLAMLAGDAPRVQKTMAGLRAEGRSDSARAVGDHRGTAHADPREGAGRRGTSVFDGRAREPPVGAAREAGRARAGTNRRRPARAGHRAGGRG